MILISGEALVDLIPDRARQNAYDAVLGGSPYNVAIGLARLGAPTAFVSRLSTDANGESFAAELAKSDVDLSFIARVAEPTTLAFVMRGTAATGARYSFYLDATSFDGPWPFPKEWPAEARHLHVGSISALDQRHGESVLAALALARRRATTSFDPNIRPLVTPDRVGVSKLVERQLALADIVKASDEDLKWLYPERDPEATIADWARRGPRFCVVTRGAEGAVAFLGNQRLEAHAPKIEVVDTVGAGDSFMSALIGAMDADGGLGRGGAPADASRLQSWLGFAVVASAITCTRKGSDPPTRAEVEAMVSRTGAASIGAP
ncbi:MAG TPA: carbohydrate kinase [Roseiarcus sp.]|nr:carbohydrate kinase [Roseiarcus sp.]